MSKPPVVKIGEKYGLLTIVAELDERNKWGRRQYQCLCKCGNTRIVTTQGLTSGIVKSCGCMQHPSLVQIGDKFGKLTVIGEADKINYTRYYRCLCECGNTRIASKQGLTSGTTKSCGCIQYQAYQANALHIGDKFGRLTVIGEAGKINYKRYYRCLCECGKEKVANGINLRHGDIRSCGCLGHPPVVHIGERYGKLTVVKEVSSVDNARRRRYECQCDCGNKTVVNSALLRRGTTKSCGCLRRERYKTRKEGAA